MRHRLIQKMRFVVGHDTTLSDEELHAQALELDLGRDDTMVRRLVTEKLRLLIKFGAPASEPDDAELREFLDAHARPAVE